MTQKNSSKIISVVHPICCGLDVHKDMVSACIIITESDGEEKFVVQEFSTFTDDLFKLKLWVVGPTYFHHSYGLKSKSNYYSVWIIMTL
jgi:hypothetical protein